MQSVHHVPHKSGARDVCACRSLQVYKAIRNGVQVVAVKIFTDQVAGDNQARYNEAFRREIFILRSCHDRNIVQFLGACLQVPRQPAEHSVRCAEAGDAMTECQRRGGVPGKMWYQGAGRMCLGWLPCCAESAAFM